MVKPAGPQQEDGHSCGAFAMVAVHMLLEGALLDLLEDPVPHRWFDGEAVKDAKIWIRRHLVRLWTANKDTAEWGSILMTHLSQWNNTDS